MTEVRARSELGLTPFLIQARMALVSSFAIWASDGQALI